MNKIMQAVNELRGDLVNQKNNVVLEQHKILIRLYGHLYLTSTPKVRFITNNAGNENFDYICTVKEFNNLVAELSAAEWIK